MSFFTLTSHFNCSIRDLVITYACVFAFQSSMLSKVNILRHRHDLPRASEILSRASLPMLFPSVIFKANLKSFMLTRDFWPDSYAVMAYQEVDARMIMSLSTDSEPLDWQPWLCVQQREVLLFPNHLSKHAHERTLLIQTMQDYFRRGGSPLRRV